MKTEGIKTWRDRITTPTTNQKNLFMSMQAEIDELRAALAERDAKLAALEGQEPVAWLVYANGSHRYSTLAFDVSKVPDIYVGGDVVALYAAAGAASEWNDFVEIACARIKSADDAAADGDYMLDSSDCIKVLRGTWGGNYLNDHPVLPAAGAAPKELT